MPAKMAPNARRTQPSTKKQSDISRRVPTRRRATRMDRVWHWLTKNWLGSALIAILAVVIGVVITSHGASGTGTTDASVIPLTSAAPRDAGNSLGKAQAPVTIVNYSDFMCPYCTILANQIEPKLIHDYVDTGKVRYITREMAFLTPASQDAAEAAACAEDQGKFWPYHNLLYAARASASDGIYTASRLKDNAVQLGINTARFDACLDSHIHENEVKHLTQTALAGGINGTPTVYINGQPLVGGQPYDAYRQAIDAALAQK